VLEFDDEEAEEAETGLFRSEVAATADEWNAVKCPELEVFELKETYFRVWAKISPVWPSHP
jgi:hypothetical protein